MMVLKPWTAAGAAATTPSPSPSPSAATAAAAAATSPPPQPMMTCEMTYKAKSKWPFIPDSAATQKQEVRGYHGLTGSKAGGSWLQPPLLKWRR